MPGSDPVAQTFDVPDARLYYERQGTGPLLLMIGSPMDSTGFAGLARALADRYTVVTYDPRGIGHSTREDATQDVTPEQQADDVHRLLSVHRGAVALADRLGTPVVEFPGDHGGFVVLPEQCGRVLDQVLTQATRPPPAI
jgi:pimeloyl-ACP methyl ester carboxylesterase